MAELRARPLLHHGATAMRVAITALIVLVTAAGCTGHGPLHSGAAIDAAGAATPALDLVGTWRGTAFAVPGSNYLVSAPVELTIKPDGTWRRTERGQERAIGQLRYRGPHLVLDETTSNNAEHRISLQRRGDTLWGLSGAFIPGAISAVELRKAP